jgi:hypothetical protein
MSKEDYLDALSQQSKMIVHQTARCAHSVTMTPCELYRTLKSGILLISRHLVNSSCCAGMVCGSVQRVGEDYKCRNLTHQETYSVTMVVVIVFALA